MSGATVISFPGRAATRPGRPSAAGPGHVAFVDVGPYAQESLIGLLRENRAAALVDLRPCPVFAKPRFRHREMVGWLHDNGVRYVEYAMEVLHIRRDPDRERLEGRAMARAVAPWFERGLVVCIHDATSREEGWLDAMRRVMRHHPGCSAELHPRALAGWLAPP